MKKIILSLAVLSIEILSAQFSISIEAPKDFTDKEVMIYTLNGSKDIYTAQTETKNGKWIVQISSPYKGMLKAYFPKSNHSINFISENKNIEMKLNAESDKISSVNFNDEANKKWGHYLSSKDKIEHILPVLKQIKNFYENQTDFGKALNEEIKKLETIENNAEENSFTEFYAKNNKYASENPAYRLSSQAYADFLVNSGELLESSSLIRPVLINFLKNLSRENLIPEVDKLLDNLDLETPRGQTVLAELLNIFDIYGLKAEKEKYYKKASALTCEINQNLKNSIKSIKNTEIGATFEDYTFTAHAKNTKAQKLSGIKANKKVVLFWSSTCPHCLSELPIILENYSLLKAKGIEVVAISLDSDQKAYEEKTNSLPWINDSELKGWKSKAAEVYNIHGTPTYYILDKDNKIIEKPRNFSEFLSSNNLK